MKKIIVLVLATAAFMYGCNKSSSEELIKAKEDLKEAKSTLDESKIKKSEAVNAKEKAEWTYFKSEADSTLVSIEKDLKRLQVTIEKADKKDKEKLKATYAKSKDNIRVLKEKLHKRDLEFEKDIKNLDSIILVKNQSFKREFKHDIDELGKSFKDLFRNNVK